MSRYSKYIRYAALLVVVFIVIFAIVPGIADIVTGNRGTQPDFLKPHLSSPENKDRIDRHNFPAEDEGDFQKRTLNLPDFPDSELPPELTFTWDMPVPGEENDVIICTPFGFEENSEDLDEFEEEGYVQNEMEIIFINRSGEPVYSLCDGVVSYVKPWYTYEDAGTPGLGGEVWVRTGRYHAVGYRHIVTAGISEGDKVFKGNIIGYTGITTTLNDENGYSIPEASIIDYLVSGFKDGKCFYKNPYLLFDDESQIILNSIWNSQQRKDLSRYQSVNSPWDGPDELETEDGYKEIPHKGGWTAR